MIAASWDLSPVFGALLVAAVVYCAVALSREHRSYRAHKTQTALDHGSVRHTQEPQP